MNTRFLPQPGWAYALECMSLTQPWASLMGRGKWRETRSWQRERKNCLIGIQAAKTFPSDAVALCGIEPFHSQLIQAGFVWDDTNPKNPFHLPLGVLLGVGHLTSVVPITQESIPASPERDFGWYAPNRFAWQFDEFAHFPIPFSLNGDRGLWRWRVPSDLPVEYLSCLDSLLTTTQTSLLSIEQIDTVVVDALRWDENAPGGPGQWCHMTITDSTRGNVEPLHRIADLMGMKRAWFQDQPTFPHYNLRGLRMRQKALFYGAQDMKSSGVAALGRHTHS